MTRICTKVLMLAVILFCGSMAYGQQILENDTLYIGSASGTGGEKVMIPVYIRTTQPCQGWQIPIKFGNGNAPVQCDSVSALGTIMETWLFKAPFTNNNEWGSVQTCGTAGVVNWTGGSIPAGYHLAMKLFFSINVGAQVQTLTIDTTRTSWYSGGPINPYIITVNGSSYVTRVIPGELDIIGVPVTENDNEDHNVLTVSPTVLRSGAVLSVHNMNGHAQEITLCNSIGQTIQTIRSDSKQIKMGTDGMSPGAYFFMIAGPDGRQTSKIVIH